jgi:energy-coupling factor transporter ATP-binding protein EcfA2
VTNLPVYMYCGKRITSEIRMPELPPGRPGRASISLRLGEAQRQEAAEPWLHHWLNANGVDIISHRMEGRGHVLRFPRLADFLVSEDARTVSCVPVPGIPLETLRHLLIDQVLPRCLAHNGHLMLHASAVIFDQKLMLFIGPSGSGKSTLAASLHQAGHPAVADDIVLLKAGRTGARAVPSYPGLRLWDDSLKLLFSQNHATHAMAHYSEKKRVVLDAQDDTTLGKGMTIFAVIVLSPTDQDRGKDIALSGLSLREAYMEIQRQLFLLDAGDAKRIRHHAASLGKIVRRLKTLRLTVPRDYDSLPRVHAVLAQSVK